MARSRRPGSHRALRQVLLITGLVVATWLAIGAVRLVQLHGEATKDNHQLQSLRTDMDRFSQSLSSGKDPGDSSDLKLRLQRETAELQSLESKLGGLSLLPMRVIPVVSRQVASARDLAAAGAQVTAAGARLTQVTEDLRSSSSGDPILVTLARADRAVAAADRSLGHIDLGPKSLLLPSLGRARARADAFTEHLTTRLDTASTVVHQLSAVLAGPRNYVLLTANNAEMSGFGGRDLQVGWMRTRHGKVKASGLRDTNQASEIIAPGAVPITDRDFAQNWGWLGPSSLWTTLGGTPRFPVIANIAARMWAVRTHSHVDGVISLDDEALVNIVKATGPVTIDDATYNADQLRQNLLVGQYAITDVAKRRARLARLTATIMGSLQNPRNHANHFAILKAFADSIRGRHLMAWSAAKPDEAMWEDLGATGQVSPSDVIIGTTSLISKLDSSLKIVVKPTFLPAASGEDVLLTIRIHDAATGHEPSYVFGSTAADHRPLGFYGGFLCVELPGGATKLATDGAPVVLGPDGASKQVSTVIELAPGGTLTRRVSFHLQAGTKSFTVGPSSHLPDITWDLGTTTRTDSEPFTVDLRTVPRTPPTKQTLVQLDTVARIKAQLARVNLQLGPLASIDTRTVLNAALNSHVLPATTGFASSLKQASAPLPDLFTIVVDLGEKRLLESLLATAQGHR